MSQESAQRVFAPPSKMLDNALAVRHLVSSVIQISRELQRVFILALYNVPHISPADISRQMELVTLMLTTWSNDFYDVLDNACILAILYQRIIDLHASDTDDLRPYLNVCLSKTREQQELCHKMQCYLSSSQMAGEFELMLKQLRCWAGDVKSDALSSSEQVHVAAITIGFLNNIKNLLCAMDCLQKLVQQFSERNTAFETHLRTILLDDCTTFKSSVDEAEAVKQKWSWHVQELIWLQAGLRHGRSIAEKNPGDFVALASKVEPMSACAKSLESLSDTFSVQDSNKCKHASFSSRTLYAIKSCFRRHFNGLRWLRKVGLDTIV